MNPEGMLTWIEALDDLTDDEFRTALKRFSRESKEFPSPAAVRQFAGSVALPDTDRATLAWVKVRESIRKVGGYETVQFDDPLITASIRDMGGWVALCDTPSEEMKWREQDFRRIYAAVAKSGIGDASALPGISERTNSKLGYAEQDAPQRIETGLAVHPVAAALTCEERPVLPRIDGPAAPLAGVLVDRMREAMEDKPAPVVKSEPLDPAAERAKLLAAYPVMADSTARDPQ